MAKTTPNIIPTNVRQYIIDNCSLTLIEIKTVLSKKFGVDVSEQDIDKFIKRSIAARKRWENIEYRNKQITKHREWLDKNPGYISGPNNPNYGKPRSDETKRKISETLLEKNIQVSEETRTKISIANKGKQPFLGHHHTEETKQRMSKTKKEFWTEEHKQEHSKKVKTYWIENREIIMEKRSTPEYKEKQSKCHLGHKRSKESCAKQSLATKGKPGHPNSETTKQKISTSVKLKWETDEDYAKRVSESVHKLWSDSEYRKLHTGENSPLWRGGMHKYCSKFNEPLRESIRNAFDRVCFLCGKPEYENCVREDGRYFRLSVHHTDFDKMQGCGGKKWRLLPLCSACNTKVNFNRWYWFLLLYNYWAMNPEIILYDTLF